MPERAPEKVLVNLPPLDVWIAIKTVLRRELGEREWEMWIQHARLWRTIEIDRRYLYRVEAAMNQLRGGTVLLSAMDIRLLGIWFDAGIPLRDILNALADMATRCSQINSLAYCQGRVLRECELMREARVGSHDSLPAYPLPSFMVALPRNSRAIFGMLRYLMKVRQLAERMAHSVVFTPAPDLEGLKLFLQAVESLEDGGEKSRLKEKHDATLAELNHPFLEPACSPLWRQHE